MSDEAREEFRVVWRIKTRSGFNEGLRYETPTLRGAAIAATMHPSDLNQAYTVEDKVESVTVQRRHVSAWENA